MTHCLVLSPSVITFPLPAVTPLTSPLRFVTHRGPPHSFQGNHWLLAKERRDGGPTGAEEEQRSPAHPLTPRGAFRDTALIRNKQIGRVEHCSFPAPAGSLKHLKVSQQSSSGSAQIHRDFPPVSIDLFRGSSVHSLTTR
ncbi:hypothetical protein JOQ06_000770 [Pogonophryne albipinna]|uniref:Uncharacterized protein n=1 Tax=Pogonophryne albipinna TaxID=1090488 RepID=A0AAD6A6M9_9TELE|nr:hypothetical protein JOQ06_000770 [Pogonophryne albipinna]